MKTQFVTLALIASILTGCATAPAVSPPDITIEGVQVATVRDAIAADMAAKKATITSISDSMITVEKPMEGGQAVAAQLLLGNAYSSTPKATLRFVLIKPSENQVRVMANGEVSTQMAFGQVNSTAVGGKDYSVLQKYLDGLKTRLEAAN
ncbi:hypothetical protein D3C76_495840 [compost metagenome]